MVHIHKLRKLGENNSGDKLGVELPRDTVRVEGLLDEDGNAVERPQIAINYEGNGTWTIQILNGDAESAGLGLSEDTPTYGSSQ